MNTTLTKADLVDAAYEAVDRPRHECKKILESLLTNMKTAIKRDHALLISGFGKFEAYAKEARRGRNPATGEDMIMEPRTVVVFRLSKKLREKLN